MRAALGGTNHYAVLGLPFGAPEAEVRRARRALSLATHPDKVQGVPGADAACKRVLAAGEALLDPGRRAAHAAEMAAARGREADEEERVNPPCPAGGGGGGGPGAGPPGRRGAPAAPPAPRGRAAKRRAKQGRG